MRRARHDSPRLAIGGSEFISGYRQRCITIQPGSVTNECSGVSPGQISQLGCRLARHVCVSSFLLPRATC